MKIKDTVGPIHDAAGQLTSEPQEMAELLNKFFASVFTEEDVIDIPSIQERTEVVSDRLEVTEGAVNKY